MAFERILTQRDIPLSELPRVKPISCAAYVKQGGYQCLEEAFHTLTPADVLLAVRESGLRGRGGGGFPTAKKWELVLSRNSPVRYLCVNGAEDEPGTLKDRYLLRSNPHQLIEGAALSAFAIGAHEGYLYVNGHYKEEIQFLEQALSEACDQGYLGRPINGFSTGIRLHIVESPGTYVAGEETALLSIIEGGAAKPREKPPYYPAIHGLFGKPTLVNNVETICNIPHIVRLRADGHKKQASEEEGDGGRGGKTMVFTLTGDIPHEGLYELPLGVSLRELIENYGGAGASGPAGAGVEGGVKAVFPGGPSNPILPWSNADIAMDFDTLKAAGSGLGTGAVIVISAKRCMVKTAIFYADFFARESCGQCPPCYLGLENLARILRKIDSGGGRQADIEQLEQVCGMIKGRGHCYLLTGGVLAVESILRHFRDEFVSHIHEARCPFESL